MEDEKDVPENTIEELVGAQLMKEERERVTECLRRNKRDIPRVDPKEAEHCLNIDLSHPPVRKKQRRFSLERNKVIRDEVDRLLEVDVIEPCQYPKWLSNVVVVNKKKGK